MNSYKNRDDILTEMISDTLRFTADKRYRAYLITEKFAYQAINRFFIGENVLEMGCCETPTTSILVRWARELTVVDMENRLPTKLFKDDKLDDIRFIRCRWEDYEPAEKYSDIVLTDGLEHVDDPPGVLSRVGTWLTENGRMHIVVPNALSVHRLLGAEMGIIDSPYSFNQIDTESGHLRVYDLNMLKSHIRQAGLKVLSIEGIQFKPLTDTQLADMPEAYVEALNRIAPLFSNYCAEIYACCTR